MTTPITVEQMVQREVMCCMSSMVDTLASNAGLRSNSKELEGLVEQAWELARPVEDYEEAATQAGWFTEPVTGNASPWWTRPEDATDIACQDGPPLFCNPQEACEFDGIEPYEWEVFEHWAVSTWLAEKLIAMGERVDTDFAGLNVWARTCTGQAISMDACMVRIHAAMLEGK